MHFLPIFDVKDTQIAPIADGCTGSQGGSTDPWVRVYALPLLTDRARLATGSVLCESLRNGLSRLSPGRPACTGPHFEAMSTCPFAPMISNNLSVSPPAATNAATDAFTTHRGILSSCLGVPDIPGRTSKQTTPSGRTLRKLRGRVCRAVYQAFVKLLVKLFVKRLQLPPNALRRNFEGLDAGRSFPPCAPTIGRKTPPLRPACCEPRRLDAGNAAFLAQLFHLNCPQRWQPVALMGAF